MTSKYPIIRVNVPPTAISVGSYLNFVRDNQPDEYAAKVAPVISWIKTFRFHGPMAIGLQHKSRPKLAGGGQFTMILELEDARDAAAFESEFQIAA